MSAVRAAGELREKQVELWLAQLLLYPLVTMVLLMRCLSTQPFPMVHAALEMTVMARTTVQKRSYRPMLAEFGCP